MALNPVNSPNILGGALKGAFQGLPRTYAGQPMKPVAPIGRSRGPVTGRPWNGQPAPIARRPWNGQPAPIAKPAYFKKGGKVKKTGWAKVHKGEVIKPAKSAAGRAMGGKKKKAPKTPRAKRKIKKTMDEWKSGTLHSGSKTGPVVKNQKQAIAIAISQARRKA